MATAAKAKMAAGIAAVLVLLFGTAYVVATHIPDGRLQRSPFAAVRWNQETPQVQVNGTWYELAAVDDQSIEGIVAFIKNTYGPDLLQKRFDEDLSDVLSGMGHPPGATVKLALKKLDTHEAVTLNDVAMTRENRLAIWKARNGDTEAPDGTVQRSPFTSVRWKDGQPQVQVDQTWYELVALDDQPTAAILAFTTKTYGKPLLEKRFDEDLVDVLTRMGHPPARTVKLDLKKLDGGEAVTLKDVPMTRENRQQVWEQRNAALLKATATAGGGVVREAPDGTQQRSPFEGIRWTADERAEVQVDGTWYQLVSLNDQPAAKLVQFSKQTYGDRLWRKRIDEDLTDLLTRMGQPPGDTVKLVLRPTGGGDQVTLEKVEMTKEKRQRIMQQKQEAERAGAGT